VAVAVAAILGHRVRVAQEAAALVEMFPALGTEQVVPLIRAVVVVVAALGQVVLVVMAVMALLLLVIPVLSSLLAVR